MAGFAQVRQWRPDPLDAAERQLKNRSERLLGLADELHASAAPAGWTGWAAEAAKGERRRITDRMEQIVAGVSATRTALMQAADAVTGLRQGIDEADGLAGANGFAIGDDGTVTDVAPPRGVPSEQAEDVARERERIRTELVDRVEQILRRAEDIDNDLTGMLGKVTNGEIDVSGATTLASAATSGAAQGGLSVLQPPQGPGTPGDNAGWWDTLSPAEQRQVIAQHPEWIGNRNGVAFAARDQANQQLLRTEKIRLQTEAVQLRGELAGEVFDFGLSEAQDRLENVEAKLASIDRLEGLAAMGRDIVALDLSGNRAEAAVANGDLDTASHVSVFTPGLESTVDGSMSDYDQNMADMKTKMKGMLRHADPDASVATVTWIGYQAPQLDAGSMLDPGNTVALDNAAQTGADKLAPFLNGIDAARDTDPENLTALGHSYGSLTTGLALQQGTGVDNAVVFGSPGLGTDNTADLKVPDGQVVSMEARDDPVADIGRSGHLGEDPSAMPGMAHGETGAVPADRSPTGQPLSGVEGHSQYFDQGSTSQHNMAAVAAGHPEKMVAGNNTDIGDVVGQGGRDFVERTKTAADIAWRVFTQQW